MNETAYSSERLTALYEVLNPWGDAGDAFCLGEVMGATAVLDVGCGTGRLLRRAREAGHTGRLCGLDPSRAMLAHARGRPDVEWVEGEARSAPWDGEFDLAVMTGHAFQTLLTDKDTSASLGAVRRALAPGGRFVFESRNPAVRPWERWIPERGRDVVAPGGERVRVEHEVVVPFDGDTVTFTETFTSDAWPAPEVSRSTLRFPTPRRLTELLTEAGLETEAIYGDWSRTPLTATSPEIIVTARRPR